MDLEMQIRELEKSLEDLRRRWPAHSVKPKMIEEMERLEDEISRLRELWSTNIFVGREDREVY